MDRDMLWRWDEVLKTHPNGMRFSVFGEDGDLLATNEYFRYLFFRKSERVLRLTRLSVLVVASLSMIRRKVWRASLFVACVITDFFEYQWTRICSTRASISTKSIRRV